MRQDIHEYEKVNEKKKMNDHEVPLNENTNIGRRKRSMNESGAYLPHLVINKIIPLYCSNVKRWKEAYFEVVMINGVSFFARLNVQILLLLSCVCFFSGVIIYCWNILG